jgi:hypothetical protein
VALLVEGAIAVALVERNADGAGSAKAAARVLIRTAIPKTTDAVERRSRRGRLHELEVEGDPAGMVSRDS